MLPALLFLMISPHEKNPPKICQTVLRFEKSFSLSTFSSVRQTRRLCFPKNKKHEEGERQKRYPPNYTQPPPPPPPPPEEEEICEFRGVIRGERKIGQKSLGFEVLPSLPRPILGVGETEICLPLLPPSPTPHILLFQFHAPMPVGRGGRSEGVRVSLHVNSPNVRREAFSFPGGCKGCSSPFYAF